MSSTSGSGRLAGKVALVTGASRGIGAAVALALAAEGATVVINYNSSAGPANELVNKIGSDRAVALKADIASVEESRGLVTETVGRYGKIDIVVLNAAIFPTNKSLEVTTEKDFDQMFSTNVKSPFFLVQEAAKHIPEGGRVIFLSTSLTALSSVSPGYLLYVASKGAIEQMSRILAKDLGKRGVTVNTVSPGPTATDGYYDGKTDQVIKMIEGYHPAGRIAQPNEIANAVVFVASPESSWVNGQNIRVNGGMTVG